MEESTRTVLTRFSRLWPVFAGVSVLLCIAGIVAGLNESLLFMIVPMVIFFIMVVVQLCQMVVAVIAGRWKHFLGGLLGLALSVLAFYFCFINQPEFIGGKVDYPVDIAASDTITYSKSEERLTCDIVALMPETYLRQAVGEWLSGYLGGTYTGEMDDLQALVDYYGTSHTDSLRVILEEGIPDFAEVSYDAGMERSYENLKAVTFELTIEQFLGGAHPTSEFFGATFSKEDGRMLTWDIIRPDSRQAFHDMLVDELKDYFGVKVDGISMEHLLGVDDVQHIPLPQSPPYLTAEGLAFIYQQYEIAPYAMGLPSAIIPYSRVKPFLTDAARELIPE